MPKKYKVLADLEIAHEVEFDEDEIPAGMDEWDYAHELAEMGAYREVPNGREFVICDIVKEND